MPEKARYYKSEQINWLIWYSIHSSTPNARLFQAEYYQYMRIIGRCNPGETGGSDSCHGRAWRRHARPAATSLRKVSTLLSDQSCCRDEPTISFRVMRRTLHIHENKSGLSSVGSELDGLPCIQLDVIHEDAIMFSSTSKPVQCIVSYI